MKLNFCSLYLAIIAKISPIANPKKTKLTNVAILEMNSKLTFGEYVSTPWSKSPRKLTFSSTEPSVHHPL